MSDRPNLPNITTASTNSSAEKVLSFEEMASLVDVFREKYGGIPDAMLSSESLWKKLEQWIKSQTRPIKPADDIGIGGVITSFSVMVVVVIDDYDALKISTHLGQLGLGRVLLGKRDAIYKLLERYDVVPKGGAELETDEER